MIILVVLSIILVALVWVRAHNAAPAPVNTTSTVSSEFTTVEYKITNIKGNQYYGKGDHGTEIHFSAKNIHSGDKIQVNDVVICYFEKDNLGKGLVKVEKK
jgi:hypothetical protein